MGRRITSGTSGRKRSNSSMKWKITLIAGRLLMNGSTTMLRSARVVARLTRTTCMRMKSTRRPITNTMTK